MTVQLTWDTDPPKTGLSDEGTDTKAYPATPASGHVEVTPEPVGSGPIVEADFTVPLIVTPNATTVEPGGTLTVNGSGLAAGSAGTLALVAGPAGTTGGATIVEAAVTADALGAIPETTLTVPAGTAEGEYHLVLSGGAVVIDNVGITVGTAPVGAAITADKTTIDSAGDEAARTVTVTGTGFPVSTAGRVSIMTGAVGTVGTEVVGADVTTGADGSIAATALIVPQDQAAGDYHVHAEYAGATATDLPLTVTNTPPVGPAITADPTTVESSGDEAARTITVSGTGFTASTAGTVELLPGAPGAGGTAVASVAVTTDAAGAFTAAALIVPQDQAAGDYHIVATVGATVSDDTAVTVTFTPPVGPVVTSDVTTVESGGTVTASGTGFPVSTAGRVGLFDAADAEVVGADITTDAAGAFAATALVVPVGTAAGDLALRATVGAAVSPDVTITVTDPATPANVTATTTSDSTVDLAWDAVTGATEYRLSYKPTSETVWIIDTLPATPTTASLPGLVPGTSYDFALQSVIGTDVSARSATATATTDAGTPLDQVVATAGTPTATEVPLSWTAIAGATNYQIRYREASATDEWSEDMPSNTTTAHTVTGLTAGTDYVFGVRATAGVAASGPWSADITATTAAALMKSATLKTTTAKRTTKKK